MHRKATHFFSIGLIIALTVSWNAEALEEDPTEHLPPYLFTTPDYAADIPVRQNPTIVRSRFVDINFNLLPNPDKKYTAEQGDEIPLILNFFPDLSSQLSLRK